MKKILFILCCAAALFSGCSAKKVNEDMAARDIPVEEQGLMDWIFYQVAPQLRTPNSNIGNRDTTRTKIKELTVNFKTNTCVLGKEISSSAGWIKNIYDKDEIPMANYACRSLYGPVDTTILMYNKDTVTIPYSTLRNGITHRKVWKTKPALITCDYNGDRLLRKDSCIVDEDDIPIEAYRINSEGNIERHYIYHYNEDGKIIGFTSALENGYNGVVTYKKNKKILKITSPDGKELVYSYLFDDQARLIKAETPAMITEYLNYDKNGNHTSTKVRMRRVLRCWYMTSRASTHTDIIYWE